MKMIEVYGTYRPEMKTEEQFISDFSEYMFNHHKIYNPGVCNFEDPIVAEIFLNHIKAEAKKTFDKYSVEIN